MFPVFWYDYRISQQLVQCAFCLFVDFKLMPVQCAQTPAQVLLLREAATPPHRAHTEAKHQSPSLLFTIYSPPNDQYYSSVCLQSWWVEEGLLHTPAGGSDEDRKENFNSATFTQERVTNTFFLTVASSLTTLY